MCVSLRPGAARRLCESMGTYVNVCAHTRPASPIRSPTRSGARCQGMHCRGQRVRVCARRFPHQDSRFPTSVISLSLSVLQDLYDTLFFTHSSSHGHYRRHSRSAISLSYHSSVFHQQGEVILGQLVDLCIGRRATTLIDAVEESTLPAVSALAARDEVRILAGSRAVIQLPQCHSTCLSLASTVVMLIRWRLRGCFDDRILVRRWLRGCFDDRVFVPRRRYHDRIGRG